MEKILTLYDILACPICKVKIERQGDVLVCNTCSQTYPIVNGVPVVFPGGKIPEVQHEADLVVRTSYDPWVHRLILQSLTDNQIVVEVGAGNMALDDPCIIRMDVIFSPYVDLVADIHALPFIPGSVDYIFSLAVFEHLRNPFTAAQSIYESLKDGGYIYHECNFIYTHHGYPHHYFNATMQGMEQIFSEFFPLRKGVATYQMPSFALNMVLGSYLKHSHAYEFPHGKILVNLLQKVLSLDLMQYDIYFSENEALNVAAGTFFAGMKKAAQNATLIPSVVRQIRENNQELQTRFPDFNDLTTVDNIMAWSFQEGRTQHSEIDRYFKDIRPFRKNGDVKPWNRDAVRSFPFQEARFGAIGYSPDNSMTANAAFALKQYRSMGGKIATWRNLAHKQSGLIQREGVNALIDKVVRKIKCIW